MDINILSIQYVLIIHVLNIMRSNIITIICIVYTVAIHSMKCLLQEEQGAKNAILIEYI